MVGCGPCVECVVSVLGRVWVVELKDVAFSYFDVVLIDDDDSLVLTSRR